MALTKHTILITLACAVLFSCSEDPATPPQPEPLASEIDFSADFSSDDGWVDESGGSFYIRGDALECEIDRSKRQRYYHPIERYQGDFTLEFDFKLESRRDIVWLEVGLAERLDGALSDPLNDPIGAFVRFGQAYERDYDKPRYVMPVAHYGEQAAYAGSDPQDLATYIDFPVRTWMHARLEVLGRFWRLTIEENATVVAMQTGSFPGTFGPYNYVYVGNPDEEDYQEGYAIVDNLTASSNVDWTEPCPDFPCEGPPDDPMPEVGNLGGNPAYFDEPFTVFWQDVWTGCGGYEIMLSGSDGSFEIIDVLDGASTEITIPRPGCAELGEYFIRVRSFGDRAVRRECTRRPTWS